jgi:hypothetical protein
MAFNERTNLKLLLNGCSDEPRISTVRALLRSLERLYGTTTRAYHGCEKKISLGMMFDMYFDIR